MAVLQLMSGMASDRTGRKPLVCLGLWASAAGLLASALGAGGLGAGGTAASPSGTESAHENQFGYLMLGACLMVGVCGDCDLHVCPLVWPCCQHPFRAVV